MQFLYTEKQVSDLMAISLSKLRHDRLKSTGMPYVKFGRSVRYKWDDIEKFILGNRVDPNQRAGEFQQSTHCKEM